MDIEYMKKKKEKGKNIDEAYLNELNHELELLRKGDNSVEIQKQLNKLNELKEYELIILSDEANLLKHIQSKILIRFDNLSNNDKLDEIKKYEAKSKTKEKAKLMLESGN